MRKGLAQAIPLLAVFSVACADSTPPAAAPGTPVDPPKQNEDLAAMMNGDKATDATKASDPAEAKKAEEAKKLADDLAKLEKDQAAEKARMTEEVRKELAALSDKKFPSFKAALEASLKSGHRSPGAADRDKERRPVEMLTFFKLGTNMSVLELDAGGGWYTELLAPILKKNGKLTVTGPDPNGPMTARPTYYGKRLRGFLDKAPELGEKVDYLIADNDAGLVIPDDKKGKFDVVLSFRNLHGWQNRNLLDKNLTAVFEALKPGGYLGVEAHRAKPGADPKESSKKGYLPEAYVIERAEAAGFKLDAKSEINANPKDTADHPEGVWTLPPTLRLGEKDKDKYLAIGESDRMTLRFIKPKTAAKKQ